MSVITEQIDEIISKRKSQTGQIDEAISKLEKADSCISKIREIQSDLSSENSNYKSLFQSTELESKIADISLKEYYETSEKYMKELKRLKSRFERDELHISIVGRMRQGKSALIQTITGLKENVIPSSNGTACTGAKSLITNENTDKVFADITFYNEREMVDKINNYLKNISHNDDYFINSFSDVSRISFDKLKSLPDLFAQQNDYIDKLETYKEHADDIALNLGKGNIRVGENDIEKYVAQYSHEDKEKRYYNFLSVKTADIHCFFPYKDVGKIKLLDTIGLEDTMLGVEDDMLKTVENDSDAIIYLRMPQSTGADVDSQDKKFISKISETVSAEYSKEMVFWIVNENGSNKEICDAYCNKIKAEDAKISEKIIVNCRDKKAVEDKLLKPILTKMKDRIQYVDEIIVKKASDFGTAVFNEYSTLASEVNNLFVGCASEDLQTEMLPQIRDAYETELLNGIRELCLGKYAELREEECKPLYEAIDNTLKNIFSFIPSKDVIIERYVRRGSNDAHESLRMCNNIARLGIIDSFNKLDIVLNDIVKGMKREVVEIMANKAFLCKITPYGGNNDDPDEWIKRFISDITLTNHYPKIEKALNDFVNFNCSVQGFLIHEVRDKLYLIDQQLKDQPDPIESKYPHYEDIADEIINILKDHLYWIAKKIRERVSALSTVPNKALFAAIYDLFDRLTFEDRKKNGEVSVPDISVKDEWEKLYKNHIRNIWAEEYDAHMSNQKISKEWRSITETISEMNKPECFKIAF